MTMSSKVIMGCNMLYSYLFDYERRNRHCFRFKMNISWSHMSFERSGGCDQEKELRCQEEATNPRVMSRGVSSSPASSSWCTEIEVSLMLRTFCHNKLFFLLICCRGLTDWQLIGLRLTRVLFYSTFMSPKFFAIFITPVYIPRFCGQTFL